MATSVLILLCHQFFGYNRRKWHQVFKFQDFFVWKKRYRHALFFHASFSIWVFTIPIYDIGKKSARAILLRAPSTVVSWSLNRGSFYVLLSQANFDWLNEKPSERPQTHKTALCRTTRSLARTKNSPHFCAGKKPIFWKDNFGKSLTKDELDFDGLNWDNILLKRLSLGVESYGQLARRRNIDFWQRQSKVKVLIF